MLSFHATVDAPDSSDGLLGWNVTCFWKPAVPPGGSELWTTVEGGAASALDTPPPELTWGTGNHEHIFGGFVLIRSRHCVNVTHTWEG